MPHNVALSTTEVRGDSPRCANCRSTPLCSTSLKDLCAQLSKTNPKKRVTKARVFRGDGEFGVSAGLRGGAGRTRTGNQTVISPTGQSSESGADKHGIEDGRRKDWHSAANRAVVSSSWGN